MRIDEKTFELPCGNPACQAKITVKAVQISPGAKVTCGSCEAVSVLNPTSPDGAPSDPGAELTRLQKSLDDLAALPGAVLPADPDDE